MDSIKERARAFAKELTESAAAKRAKGEHREAVRESNLARMCEAFASDEGWWKTEPSGTAEPKGEQWPT